MENGRLKARIKPTSINYNLPPLPVGAQYIAPFPGDLENVSTAR
jgi:hypothetical protein